MLVALFGGSACADRGGTGGAGDYPDRARERLYRYGRLGGEGGLVQFEWGRFDSGADRGWDLQVNPTLWRAALDTIAFMPITSADPRSGVILTDWYAQPGSSTERFKVDILVRGEELKPDSLHVSVFRQIRAGAGGWRDAPVSDGVADSLARSVLAHARPAHAGLDPADFARAHLGHQGGAG